MSARILVLGAAVVLAAVIGLYVLLRAGDPRSGEASPRSAGPSSAEVDPGTIDPQRPSADATLALPMGSGTTVTDPVVRERRSRDHRSGAHAAIEDPPAVHPPGGRKVASELTSRIARALRAEMAGCASSVPPEARGTRPRVDGEIAIAIKDHQATITAATLQPRDVTGDAGDVLMRCLHDRAVGLATASGDEADLEHYSIALSLIVP